MEPLTKELISDTTYCQLGLRLGPSMLDAMIYNPLQEGSLICQSFPLGKDEARLKSLEEIVYENPLLLSEFSKVNIVVETPKFTVVPGCIADNNTLQMLLDTAHPDTADLCETVINHVEAVDADFLTAIPQKETNFLHRTFDNPPIHLNLALLTRYCCAQLPKGNTAKMFVNLRDDSADVIALTCDRLLMANRFSYRTTDDLLYYVLASTEALGMRDAEILVGGSRTNRDAILSGLRNFCPSVMPMIFPSAMFRAGKAATTAPFDLIILPLCE